MYNFSLRTKYTKKVNIIPKIMANRGAFLIIIGTEPIVYSSLV